MSKNWNLDLLGSLSLCSAEGHDASFRETVSLPSDEELQNTVLNSWKASLEEEFGPEASFVYLATCHRIEFFYYGIPAASIKGLWAELCGQKVLKATETEGTETFRHALEVTSSLASEVLGETQITGQIKRAFERSVQNGWSKSGGILQRSFQEVLRATKRIRNESSIGTGTISVAHVAIDGLEDVFSSLEDKRALVVGAGTMAQQSIERLMKHNVKHITWINRTQERILKNPLSGFCEVANIDDLNKLSWEHSITILATSAQSPLLIRDVVGNHARLAETPVIGPKVILDLGLPRNADNRLHGQMQFLVRNVDEFRDRADNVSSSRRQALPKAQNIVAEETKKFLSTWNHWSQGRLIAELFESSDRYLQDELLRLQEQFGVEEKSEMEYVVKDVYSKMMHQLLAGIRSLEDSQAESALEALVLAWRKTNSSWQNQQAPKNQ